MHLIGLKIAGFKSFVDPVDVPIEEGLTGIVGPNGCGKSNLLEALRWVMGESSYKSMRASGMDDVIFSGTTQRPARNMAEVMVTLVNDDGAALPHVAAPLQAQVADAAAMHLQQPEQLVCEAPVGVERGRQQHAGQFSY